MIPSNRKEFLEVVIGFAELKGKKLSAPALELYWNSMQKWDIADFKAAASLLLSRCEFMPTPKDFEDLRKAGRASSGEAWALVLDRVRKGASIWHRGDFAPNFKPPENALITAAVEAIGGYKAIAMHDESTLHFLERRFCEHYDAIGDREEIREALPQIAERPDWLRLQMDQARKRLTQT